MEERPMTTQRVLICTQFGGWGVSRAALHRLRAMGNEHALAETDTGETWPGSDTVRDLPYDSFLCDIPRDDPHLLAVFDEMGQEAAGPFCTMSAVEIPAGVEWDIEEYDGSEHVAEAHRTWR